MPGSSFELSLSQIADARISQDAPSLTEYKVGFQLIDKNDDDTRGVGVMVFKVGKQWIYVPVFYINGKIKGTDLMYLQQQSIFAPCKENWLTFFKSKQASPLGEVSDEEQKRKADNGRPGSVSILGSETRIIKTAERDRFATRRMYNMLDKRASLALKRFDNKFSLVDKDDFRRMFDLTFEKNAFDLRKWLPRFSKKASVIFMNLLNSNTDFANKVLEFYTPVAIGAMVKAAAEANTAKAKPEPALTESVKIITMESPEAKDLNDSQKEVLVKEKMIILDNRKVTSSVFKDSMPSVKMNTPSSPGRYKILMQDGSMREVYVFLPGSAVESFGSSVGRKPSETLWRSDSMLILEPIFDKVKRVATRDVMGSKVEEKTDFLSLGKPISALKDAPVSTNEILIFDSRGNSKEFRPSDNGFIGNTIRGTLKNRTGFVTLKITEHDGVLHQSAGTLFVPKNARYLEIDYEVMHVGSLAALDAMLKDKSGVKPLKVYSDGMEVVLSGDNYNTGPLNKNAALRELVITHGIAADTARLMIKEACSCGRPKANRYLVKMANVTPIQVESVVGKESPNIITEEVVGGKLSGEDAALIERAVNAGQKDVMDVSILKILATKTDTLTQIDEYVPDLIKGMDRIGRLLFLYYWHNDDFKSRYGSDEMVELEDSLRNVFISLSDLVLFLHKKSISQSSVLEMSSGELAENIGV